MQVIRHCWLRSVDGLFVEETTVRFIDGHEGENGKVGGDRDTVDDGKGFLDLHEAVESAIHLARNGEIVVQDGTKEVADDVEITDDIDVPDERLVVFWCVEALERQDGRSNRSHDFTLLGRDLHVDR